MLWSASGITDNVLNQMPLSRDDRQHMSLRQSAVLLHEPAAQRARVQQTTMRHFDARGYCVTSIQDSLPAPGTIEAMRGLNSQAHQSRAPLPHSIQFLCIS